MTSTRRKSRIALLAVCLALLTRGEAAAAARFSGQLLPSYFAGDYGSGSDTDIYYVPLILGVATQRQEFKATFPWLSIRTEEPVTFVGGDIINRPSSSMGETTESGIGDIVLKEEVYLMMGDASHRPWISGIARVKLPTADETRGLGTGEADYGAGVGYIQPLGPKWSLLAELQYVVRGDPPGYDLKNTLWVDAGVQYAPTPGASLYLLVDSRQSVIRGRKDLRDLSLGYSHHLTKVLSFESAVYRGLSSTAEDYGLMLGLKVKQR